MGSKHKVFIDPRGLPVEFTEAGWNWITQKHPDLLENNITEDFIVEAIANPCDGCIYASNKYPGAEIYYKRYSKKLQIRVVVEFSNNIGRLKTAHFLTERSKGERIVWMKGTK